MKSVMLRTSPQNVYSITIILMRSILNRYRKNNTKKNARDQFSPKNRISLNTFTLHAFRLLSTIAQAQIESLRIHTTYYTFVYTKVLVLEHPPA